MNQYFLLFFSISYLCMILLNFYLVSVSNLCMVYGELTFWFLVLFGDPEGLSMFGDLNDCFDGIYWYD